MSRCESACGVRIQCTAMVKRRTTIIVTIYVSFAFLLLVLRITGIEVNKTSVWTLKKGNTHDLRGTATGGGSGGGTADAAGVEAILGGGTDGPGNRCGEDLVSSTCPGRGVTGNVNKSVVWRVKRSRGWP